MKIESTFKNKATIILDEHSRNSNTHASNGSVVIQTGWRGDKKKSLSVTIPPIMLRRVRDACNQALRDIDGFERHTTVTVGGTLYKEIG